MVKTERYHHRFNETSPASTGGSGLVTDLPETLDGVFWKRVDVIPTGLPPSPVPPAAALGRVEKGP